jgi:hypothetical protein
MAVPGPISNRSRQFDNTAAIMLDDIGARCSDASFELYGVPAAGS